jgi:hypothetical protein
MGPHEEFLELCSAATAGELTDAERAKLDAHLVVCLECRQALREFEFASQHAMPALASEFTPTDTESNGSWSIARAEKAFFERLENEQESAKSVGGDHNTADRGQRFTYRPSLIRWREVWMPFAAAVLLALALGIAAYRTGVKRGTNVARTTPEPPKNPPASLEEQVSDAGHEHAQLIGKLAEENRIIAHLRWQLSTQQREVNALKARGKAEQPAISGEQPSQVSNDGAMHHNEELRAAQTNLQQLQKAMETLNRSTRGAYVPRSLLRGEGQ